MEDRATRIGKNEALLREVNEQINVLNTIGAQASSFPAVCECGSLTCAEVVPVARSDYEAVRAHPDRFLIKPGHQIEDVEDVVVEHAGWAVVAKKAGTPRRVAQESDPRQ